MLFCLLPYTTFAYFSNSGNTSEGDFLAGTLAITATQNKTGIVISQNVGDSMTFDTVNTGEVDEQYRVTTTPVNCAAGFWGGLIFTLTKGDVLYQGPAHSVVATSSSEGTWSVAVQATSSLAAAENETCDLTLDVVAWQAGFVSSNSGGFSDSISIPLTITVSEDLGQQPTATVVLNEVYPNPNFASSSPLNIEWIELYNGTNSAVDVSGWVIGELSGVSEDMHTIVGDCTGYTVSDHMEPYGTSNTVIAPGGLLVVRFCGASSYLNDSGDTVTLRQSTTTAPVDLYTYTNAIKGKSIARIPDGSKWVDPIPTPGTPNIATEEELIDAGWNPDEIAAVLGEAHDDSLENSHDSVFRFADEDPTHPDTAVGTDEDLLSATGPSAEGSDQSETFNSDVTEDETEEESPEIDTTEDTIEHASQPAEVTEDILETGEEQTEKETSPETDVSTIEDVPEAAREETVEEKVTQKAKKEESDDEPDKAEANEQAI